MEFSAAAKVVFISVILYQMVGGTIQPMVEEEVWEKAGSPEETDNKFIIYWNAQTQRCKKKYGVDVDVIKYGIVENSGDDGWHGDKITIFPTLGYYPEVLSDGSVLNGGIPQVSKHESISIFLEILAESSILKY